jgi:RimJ/RimL family protein N-acetyltransferase
MLSHYYVRKGYEGQGISFKIVKYATNYAFLKERYNKILLLFRKK